MSRRAPRPVLALLAATSIALAACGSDADDDAQVVDERDGDTAQEADQTTTAPETTTTTTLPLAGGASSSETTAPDTTVPETTAAPTTTEATTTTVAPEEPEGPCLVGDWRLREQAYLEQLAAAAGAAAQGASFAHEGGAYRLTILDDGTYTAERDAWRIRVTTSDGAIIATIDSDDGGTYSVEGDVITVNENDSTATVTAELEIGGQLQPLPAANTQTVGVPGLSGSGVFECTADSLTITLTDGIPDLPPAGLVATWDRA